MIEQPVRLIPLLHKGDLHRSDRRASDRFDRPPVSQPTLHAHLSAGRGMPLPAVRFGVRGGSVREGEGAQLFLTTMVSTVFATCSNASAAASNSSMTSLSLRTVRASYSPLNRRARSLR